MDHMSRPHFCRCAQAALVACMALTASACGKGLFVPGPLVDASGDGATSVDAADGAPPETDGPVLPAFDAYPDQQVPSDGVALPDGAALPDSAADGIGPPPSKTETIDSPGGSVIFGNATLVVPRDAFAQNTFVTLTLISDDGTLADHPGAIGPIFSLSKTDATSDATPGSDVTLQQPATFELRFTPADTSIPAQRVALAYLNTQSNPNLWIAIYPDSSYDAKTGVLTGSVVEFSGTRLFAPVESCPTGQACPDPETCGGQACQ
jgi:hypothetical protein